MVIIIMFMRKKLLIGTAILLVGFLLGGLAFYFIGKMTGQQGGYLPYFAPEMRTQLHGEEKGDVFIDTNNHVVEKSDEIKVTLLDKRMFKGRIVGADPKTDIAIVKIDAANLPTIPWGDSEKLQVGEFVLAIGNPYGLSHTVTMGIT